MSMIRNVMTFTVFKKILYMYVYDYKVWEGGGDINSVSMSIQTSIHGHISEVLKLPYLIFEVICSKFSYFILHCVYSYKLK